MNINAGHQKDPRSFKEILLAIKLRSERRRVKEVYVADEAEDNISHEDVFQKKSHEDVFKKILTRMFSKKFSQGCLKKVHKDVFKTQFSQGCFPKTILTRMFSKIQYFSRGCFQQNSHEDVFQKHSL